MWESMGITVSNRCDQKSERQRFVEDHDRQRLQKTWYLAAAAAVINKILTETEATFLISTTTCNDNRNNNTGIHVLGTLCTLSQKVTPFIVFYSSKKLLGTLLVCSLASTCMHNLLTSPLLCNLHYNHSLNGQFPRHPGQLIPECQTVLDIAAAWDDGGGIGDNWNCFIIIIIIISSLLLYSTFLTSFLCVSIPPSPQLPIWVQYNHHHLPNQVAFQSIYLPTHTAICQVKR